MNFLWYIIFVHVPFQFCCWLLFLQVCLVQISNLWPLLPCIPQFCIPFHSFGTEADLCNLLLNTGVLLASGWIPAGSCDLLLFNLSVSTHSTHVFFWSSSSSSSASSVEQCSGVGAAIQGTLMKSINLIFLLQPFFLWVLQELLREYLLLLCKSLTNITEE